MKFAIWPGLRHVLSIAAVTVITAVWLAGSAYAIDRFAQSKNDGLAIKGYDTTAYKSDGKAEPGSTPHVVEWKGATWRFASAEDAATFKAKPEAYAPQFGGYCTRAMSKKITIAASPKIWRIYNGRLYMFFAPIGLKKFNEAPEPMIAKAQAFWDTLEKSE